MLAYVVAFAAAALGVLTVLFALYWDREVLKGASAPEQDWGVLPLPADIRHIAYPTAMRGYDPVAVESSLDAIAVAYGELLAVTTPEQRARARRNVARRTGQPFDVTEAPEIADEAEVPGSPAAASALPPQPGSQTSEALRREAALSAIEHDARD